MPPFPANRLVAPPAHVPLPVTFRETERLALELWRMVEGEAALSRRYLLEELYDLDPDPFKPETTLETLTKMQRDALECAQRCKSRLQKIPSRAEYSAWREALADPSAALPATTLVRRLGNSWWTVRRLLGEREPTARPERRRFTANGGAITRPEAILMCRLCVVDLRDLHLRQSAYRAWTGAWISRNGERISRETLATAVASALEEGWLRDNSTWRDNVEAWPNDPEMADETTIRHTLNVMTTTVFASKHDLHVAVGLPLAFGVRRGNHSGADDDRALQVLAQADRWSRAHLGRPLSKARYRAFLKDVNRRLAAGEKLEDVVEANVLPLSDSTVATRFGGWPEAMRRAGVISDVQCLVAERRTRRQRVRRAGLDLLDRFFEQESDDVGPAAFDRYIDDAAARGLLGRTVRPVSSSELIAEYGSWELAVLASFQRRAHASSECASGVGC